MTSEICLMNRLSVVLAADSATTVTYWNGNEMEERYFKGANKIFQLSEHHPIGVMIYDAADILRVPWESLIKEFRKSLKDRSFNNVSGYADEFLLYVNDNIQFLPLQVRREAFLSFAKQAILSLTLEHRSLEPSDIKEKSEAYAAAAKDASYPGDAPFSKDDFEDLVEKYGAAIEAEFADWVEILKYDPIGAASDYNRIILVKAIQNIKEQGPQTGLVFAGFGTHSVFPELVHLKACKFWDEKFISGSVETEAPDYDTPAVISGFAQTSMTDTFSLGFSEDVWGALGTALAESIIKLTDDIEESLGANLHEDAKRDLLLAAQQSVRTKVLQHAKDKHAQPMRRVLGMLPVDEMGELAETLINLQSLKEKVTKPSETVGGPVDVAAITKGEGLVWIKRKHYFRPEINSRYFDRRNGQ